MDRAPQAERDVHDSALIDTAVKSLLTTDGG